MFESIFAKALLGIVLGGGFGVLYSRLTRCSTGTCPLTSNWWLAGLFGAAFGLVIAFSSASNAGTSAAPASQKVKSSQSRPAASQPQGEKKMPKNIESTDDFDKDVLKSSKPVLVDFYATWCGPCRFLAPVMEQIAAEQGDKVNVVKIDVDKASDLAARYSIQGVPTVMLFDGGKAVKTFVGVRSKAEYLSAIESAGTQK